MNGRSVHDSFRPDGRLRAAEYVRMSTDHQRYSIENQSALITAYADANGMRVVRSYSDPGRSGVSLRDRPGLASLLADILAGRADFEVVLVYDVSRWGRFQDPDESAHYEFLCRSAGIRIMYCAEQFADDTPFGSVLKALKRAMAGEYSRELSVKVLAGQTRLVRLGYRQGGAAGYGLRRQVLKDGRSPGAVLTQGQRKAVQTDRIVLIPGPPEEVAVVRRIYRDYIYLRCNAREIALALNTEGISDHLGHRWTRHKVETILSNEKYIGQNVYSRLTSKLKARRVANPPEAWVRHDNAFGAVVPLYLFEAARKIREYRSGHFTDEQIYERLAELLSKNGMLNGDLIDRDPWLPSSGTVKIRLGGLNRVYEHLGYFPRARYRFHETDRLLKEVKAAVESQLLEAAQKYGLQILQSRSGLLTLSDKRTVEVVMSRCRERRNRPAWRFLYDRNLGADFAVVVRMSRANDKIQDFLLVGKDQMRRLPLYVSEADAQILKEHSLRSLSKVVERLQVGRSSREQL